MKKRNFRLSMMCALLLLLFVGGYMIGSMPEDNAPAPSAGSDIISEIQSSVISQIAEPESSGVEEALSSVVSTVPESSDIEEEPELFETDTDPESRSVEEDGVYTSVEEVALYIHTYGKLPSNYLTKKEAMSRGWDSSKGNLDEVCPGMSIGGDRFGNREGILPEAKGRKYTECDIDYSGGKRNAKRIVFSNDGLIYYTEDHYNSFELLYE